MTLRFGGRRQLQTGEETSAAGARSEKEELREDGAFVDDREQEDQWQTLIFSELTERCKVVQHLNQLLTDQKCQLMEMVASGKLTQAQLNQIMRSRSHGKKKRAGELPKLSSQGARRAHLPSLGTAS